VPVVDPPKSLGISPGRGEQLGVRPRVVHYREITLLPESVNRYAAAQSP
jgi:hypothetical protein